MLAGARGVCVDVVDHDVDRVVGLAEVLPGRRPLGVGALAHHQHAAAVPQLGVADAAGVVAGDED